MMPRACLASLLGAIRGGKVHRYGIRSATGFAYLCDNTVGFIGGLAVMDENLGTGRGERESALARPMPRDAPVTRAVLPVRADMIVVLVVAGRIGEADAPVAPPSVSSRQPHSDGPRRRRTSA